MLKEILITRFTMAYYYTFYERSIHAKKSYEMYAKLVEKPAPRFYNNFL